MLGAGEAERSVGGVRRTRILLGLGLKRFNPEQIAILEIIVFYNTKVWDADRARARVTLETKMRIFACTLSSESDYLRPIKRLRHPEDQAEST